VNNPASNQPNQSIEILLAVERLVKKFHDACITADKIISENANEFI
jgi:hypothetical protein